jgi:hypothetical protein
MALKSAQARRAKARTAERTANARAHKRAANKEPLLEAAQAEV